MAIEKIGARSSVAGTTEAMRAKLAPKSSNMMIVEILVEIIQVTNLPITHEGNLVLSVSKKQHGIVFGGNTRISISKHTEETQGFMLQCEPSGDLLFELSSDSNMDLSSFGTTSISLVDLLKSSSKLTTLRGLEFGLGTEPVTVSVAISITPPTPAPPMNGDLGDLGVLVSGVQWLAGCYDGMKGSPCMNCGAGVDDGMKGSPCMTRGAGVGDGMKGSPCMACGASAGGGKSRS